MTQEYDLAFPTNIVNPSGMIEPEFHTGLTKREYFAAMAMQGVVANGAMIDTTSWEWLAENSVKTADALINALNKGQ